ncbi:SulP family inorganic anion transporter [Pseudomonas batumici]|uniref:Sulfate permease n=1 Tax=Pseudomonas batumici TaxID=226910 RepID=A0A0C2EYG5_9PSED|nr:SulP family inorganic anion transporter [Pseudomonas batumici]KIH83833.1 Sulfate permease [Pseudomonas batumici]
MIAIREAWKSGLLGRKHWPRNLVSGVIVGIVALPLSMAFAIASGVKPEQGIYTAIVGGLLVSLFGGSRLQIAGPTGAFIVILAGVTARYGIDGLQIATFMAGAILLLLGITRLGAIIKFIPDPVIVGFTAGIGVIIWVGQWKDFFGLPKVADGHFHERLWHLLEALPNLHPTTTLLALLSLLLVLLTPRLPGMKRVPGPLLAMVVATVIQAVFQFPGVATIGSAFGGIPQGLPTLSLPEVTLPRIIELIGPAFAIAMLGAIESLLSAVVADGMAGTRHDSNQELIGQGIANLISPLFAGFAATGAIARTATNIRNGGNSPLAGLVHALTLVLLVSFLAPLASDIPLCTLAAILFVVAYNMSELKHFKRMLQRAPRADIAILLVTFMLTVFSDLTIAVNIGVILAMLQFMRRMASSVEVQRMVGKDLEVELRLNGQVELPANVLVYGIEGPLFFGAAETFERVLAQTHTDPGTLIIRLNHVPFMDITGLQTLLEVIEQLRNRNIVVKLCEANEKVLGKLRKAGILQALGPGHYHADFHSALSAASPSGQ